MPERRTDVAEVVESTADRNVREYHSIEGGEQTPARLAEYLSTRLAEKKQGGVK